jgi:hypothetical protein
MKLPQMILGVEGGDTDEPRAKRKYVKKKKADDVNTDAANSTTTITTTTTDTAIDTTTTIASITTGIEMESPAANGTTQASPAPMRMTPSPSDAPNIENVI